MKMLLLEKYFNLGWLEKSYYQNGQYQQPYSAQERLKAGLKIYQAYQHCFNSGRLVARYDIPRGDGVFRSQCLVQTENFRNSLNKISPMSVSVIEKIVLREQEIHPPRSLSTREKLYFNNEIKGLLCRGLDDVIRGGH